MYISHASMTSGLSLVMSNCFGFPSITLHFGFLSFARTSERGSTIARCALKTLSEHFISISW